MSKTKQYRQDDKGTSREFQNVYRKLQQIAQDIGGLSQGLAGVQRFASGIAKSDVAIPLVRWRSVQETITGDEYAVLYLWIEKNADNVGTVYARTDNSNRVGTGKTFAAVTVTSGPSTFLNNEEGWSGDYYKVSLVLPHSSKGKMAYIEAYVTNSTGDTIWGPHIFEYDPDKDPEFRTAGLTWGSYTPGSNTYDLQFYYSTDEDTASIEWAVHSAYANPETDANYSSGGTYLNGGNTNNSIDDGLSVHNVAPDTEVFVIARARTGAGATGDKGTSPNGVFEGAITAPPLGDDTKMNHLIKLSWLLEGMDTVTFDGGFDPTASSRSWDQVRFTTGTIYYHGDGVSYAATKTLEGVASGADYTLNSGASPDFEYVYFDPDVSTTDLKTSTDIADAVPTDANPKRVLIAMMRSVSTSDPGYTNEYVFVLANGMSSVFITAVVAKFGSLEALLGKMDVLEIKDELTLETGGRFVTTGFNGTFSGDDITAVGSAAGFAMTTNGDFAFVHDANNFIYFNGSELVISGGDANATIDDDGFRVEIATTLNEQNRYSLVDSGTTYGYFGGTRAALGS